MSGYKRALLVGHRRGLRPGENTGTSSQQLLQPQGAESSELSKSTDDPNNISMLGIGCKRKFGIHDSLEFDGAPQKVFASESHVIECLRELHLFDNQTRACLAEQVGLPANFTDANNSHSFCNTTTDFTNADFEIDSDANVSAADSSFQQPVSDDGKISLTDSDSDCEDESAHYGQRLHIEDPELQQALNGLYKQRLSVLARLKGAHVNLQRDLEDGIPLTPKVPPCLTSFSGNANTCRSVVLWTPVSLALPLEVQQQCAASFQSARIQNKFDQCTSSNSGICPTVASSVQMDTVRNELITDDLVDNAELESRAIEVEAEGEMQIEPI